MGNEEEPLTTKQTIFAAVLGLCVFSLAIGGVIWIAKHNPMPDGGLLEQEMAIVQPKIELVSMDFTVLNITETHLSATWDLSIRIPYFLPDHYVCRQGDLQASLLYKKNITLASSIIRYNHLRRRSPQLLKISAVVSNEDIGRFIGKDLMEDVMDKKEVQFGTQLFLTDCRLHAAAMMSFACDEATLRFEPSSQMKATLFGNHSTCIGF